MKAVFSEAALADINQIFEFTATNYPSLVPRLEYRIRDVVSRIEAWPENARLLEGTTNTRVVPLVRYPFKIFYQIDAERILILHIHHTSRSYWTA